MMERILSKLLDKEGFNMSTDMEKAMNENPDAVKLAQELVKKGGVFDNYIENDLLGDIDPSYKNQFVNWAWCAFADESTFKTYMGNFDKDGINDDTHLTTEFKDRVSDFCVHMKKHADFRDDCRKILNQINSKPNHINVPAFSLAMLKMNEEWDKKKKFIVTNETIEKAWAMIEKNEIKVDNNYGKFSAYKIPNWWSLMQTCHKTSWCVAQKGDSGERYYDSYGEPYYLICDGRRSPFALLNPPSKQFKGIDDSAVCRLSDIDKGDVPPSKMKLLMFTKEVLSKIGLWKSSNFKKDLSCFEKMSELKKIDELYKNDTTDYARLMEESFKKRDKIKDKEKTEKADKERIEKKIGEGDFIEAMHDDDFHNDVMNKYNSMSDDEKNKVCDEVLHSDGIRSVFSFIVEDCMKRGRVDIVTKFMDNDVFVRRWNEYTPVGNFIATQIFNYDDSIAKMPNKDEFMTRLFLIMENGSYSNNYKRNMFESALDSGCSDKVCMEMFSKWSDILLDTSSSATLVNKMVDGISRGALDESVLKALAEKYKKTISEKTSWWIVGEGENITKMIEHGCFDENTIKEIFNKTVLDESEYYESFEIGKACIKMDNGELSEPLVEKIKTFDSGDKDLLLDDSFSGNKYACVAASPKCTSDILENLLGILNYGKGFKMTINSRRIPNGRIFGAILDNRNLTKEQFDKMLSTNPSIVVCHGWNCKYCTKAVRIALIRKIAKKNGKIFNIDYSDHEELYEYFKQRIDAGKYSDVMDYFGSRPPYFYQDIMVYLIMNMKTSDTSFDHNTMEIISSHLSQESVSYLLDNIDKCKMKWTMLNLIFKTLRTDEQVQWLIDRSDEKEVMTVLENYVNRFDKWSKDKISDETIRRMEDAFLGSNADDVKKKAPQLFEILIENDNCPLDYVKNNYEMARLDCGGVIARAIKEKLYPVEKICKDISELKEQYSSTYENIVDAIVKNDYTEDEKNEMFYSFDFKKINFSTAMDTILSNMSGDKLLQKFKEFLNTEENVPLCPLIENKSYTREQLVPFIKPFVGHERNYMTNWFESWYKRFGMDDIVINSSAFNHLVDRKAWEFSPHDIEIVMNSGNEDAIWALKNNLRHHFEIVNKLHKDDKDASSKMKSVSMKVAFNEAVTDGIARIILKKLDL